MFPPWRFSLAACPEPSAHAFSPLDWSCGILRGGDVAGEAMTTFAVHTTNVERLRAARCDLLRYGDPCGAPWQLRRTPHFREYLGGAGVNPAPTRLQPQPGRVPPAR